MKTIIKDGKRNVGAFTFKCEKCGCKFKADVADYDYRTDKGKISEVPTDVISSECPNCCECIKRNVYTYTPLEKIKIVLTHKFKVKKTFDTQCAATIISVLSLIANSVVYMFFAATYPSSFIPLLILWAAIFILFILIATDDCV